MTSSFHGQATKSQNITEHLQKWAIHLKLCLRQATGDPNLQWARTKCWLLNSYRPQNKCHVIEKLCKRSLLM